MRIHARFLILSLVTLLCGNASAQFLIALSRKAGTPVARVNPNSGTIQFVASAGWPEPKYAVGTIDTANRVAYYVGGAWDEPLSELFAFTLKDRQRTWIPYACPGCLPWLVWDNDGRQLLSIRNDPIEVFSMSEKGERTITQLDPAFSGLIWGVYAFDPVGKRLFFEIGNGAPELLAVVDIATGNYRVVPLSGLGHWFLRYDPRSNRLLTYGNGCRPELRSIDPETGLEEIIAIVPTEMNYAALFVSALDEEGRRLFYLTEDGKLVTFDLERHSFTSMPFPDAIHVGVMEYLPNPNKLQAPR